MNQKFRTDSYLQVAMLVFSEGQYQGYSLASKTTSNSDNPVLTYDGSGNLHLAWREGARGRSVFYTTTNPAAMVELDRLELGDFFYGALQGTMDGIASIAFLPFVGFGWILPGIIILGIWKLIKDQEVVTEPTSWILLILAILIFYGVKLISP